VLGIGASARGVASGHEHSCAITDAGGVRCWGNNGHGQLGTGTYASDGAPVDVIGLRGGVASVVAGDHHSCAITDAGRALCWGDNTWGQLGDGSQENRFAPVPVQGLAEGVLSISAGGAHTCAVTVLDELYCWGHAGYGQLGAQAAWATSPVAVGGFGP
jgi:alpha-tubulin suppressor-like RCC1 family protein